MQAGSLKRIRHRGLNVWRAQWREDGRGRTRILGRCSEMNRADARAELVRIMATVNTALLDHGLKCTREGTD